MKKLAVIGANAPLEPFYRRAKKLNYYIIGIAWEEGAICKKYCDKFYPVSFTDKDAILEICKKENIDGITSFSLESAIPTVVYVAQRLGLVSNDEECLLLTSNKYTMRTAFREAGIPVPQYFLVKEQNDLYNKKINFPVIIKPVDSGGSQGVNKVNNMDDLLNAYNYARNHSKSGTVIVEEYVDGREFSVEYLSYNDRHYYLQITDKVTSGPPHFVEMQHHQPANISLDLVESIKKMVEKALTTLKIKNSPSHTEIKLNSRGELYIIEVGPRLGGDFITSDLVRLSTGYDMVGGALEIATRTFTPPVIIEHKFSGVYFYSKLAENIGEIIANHSYYPDIVECEISTNTLPEVHSNADRGGYLLYQSVKSKLEL